MRRQLELQAEEAKRSAKALRKKVSTQKTLNTQQSLA